MTVLNAFSGILAVFSVALVGYLLARGKWITPDIAAKLPRFLTVIALPAYLLRTITTTVDRSELAHLAQGAFLPFLSMVLAFGLAVLAARLLGVAKGRRGIFCTAFATSNSLNIGLPINIALFGEAALPYVMLYFLANIVFFSTIGIYAIACDGEGPTPALFSLGTVRRIFSPPLIGMCGGLVLVLLDLRLPDFIDKAFSYIGGLAIGLILIYLGIMMHTTATQKYKLEKDVLAVLAGRFLISPLIVVLLVSCVDIPVIMRNVFIIQSSLPVMVNLLVMSGYYKAAPQYAAMLVGLSTMLSLVVIPVYMLLLSM
jgi:hypothetical protein